jgi:hypothetical protein
MLNSEETRPTNQYLAIVERLVKEGKANVDALLPSVEEGEEIEFLASKLNSLKFGSEPADPSEPNSYKNDAHALHRYSGESTTSALHYCVQQANTEMGLG